jgi:hypothetical protein
MVLTESGERCVHRLAQLSLLDLPSPQLVTAAATAVEVHVSRILARLIALSDLLADRFAAAMIEDLEEDFVRTWRSRATWLDKGFDVQFAGTAEYQNLQVAVDLRNAIVHGDEQLTDLQTKNLNKVMALRKKLWSVLDVDCQGIRFRYAATSQDRILEVMAAFVVRFDQVVLSQHPEAARL